MVVVPCCSYAYSGGHAHTVVVALFGCCCYGCGCGYGEVCGMGGCNGYGKMACCALIACDGLSRAIGTWVSFHFQTANSIS